MRHHIHRAPAVRQRAPSAGPARGRAHPGIDGDARRAFVSEALRWLPDGVSAADWTAGRAAPNRTARPATAPASCSPTTTPICATICTRLLATSYEVRAVADGEEALAAARRERPDLILADVMMPRLDGFGLLQKLRDDPALRTCR